MQVGVGRWVSHSLVTAAEAGGMEHPLFTRVLVIVRNGFDMQQCSMRPVSVRDGSNCCPVHYVVLGSYGTNLNVATVLVSWRQVGACMTGR